MSLVWSGQESNPQPPTHQANALPLNHWMRSIWCGIYNLAKIVLSPQYKSDLDSETCSKGMNIYLSLNQNKLKSDVRFCPFDKRAIDVMYSAGFALLMIYFHSVALFICKFSFLLLIICWNFLLHTFNIYCSAGTFQVYICTNLINVILRRKYRNLFSGLNCIELV